MTWNQQQQPCLWGNVSCGHHNGPIWKQQSAVVYGRRWEGTLTWPTSNNWMGELQKEKYNPVKAGRQRENLEKNSLKNGFWVQLAIVLSSQPLI